jgi:hypothetical protein
MFTSSEVLFLSKAHGTSDEEKRSGVPGMVALESSMQIPEQILQGILQRRAKRLGMSFEEFRNKNTVPSLNHKSEVSVLRLF